MPNADLVRGDDLLVNHGGKVEVNIILGHAHLLRHLYGLDFDIHRLELLTPGVDLDQTGVDGAFESGRSKYGDFNKRNTQTFRTFESN